MKIQVATIVDIGTTLLHNDDRALVGTELYNESRSICEITFPFVAAVCDGVGGYSGGGYAAELALKELRNHDSHHLHDPNYLAEVLQNANTTILNAKDNTPEFSKMCTTIAGVVFTDSSITLFHAGDSRIYRFDGEYLARMTTDHSLVQELISTGVITEDRARVSNERSIIRRCLGITNCLPPEIREIRSSIEPGDMYLICSDGLWDVLTDAQIKSILSQNIPIGDKVNLLVLTAKQHGSEDNITACLCVAESKEPVLERQQHFALD